LIDDWSREDRSSRYTRFCISIINLSSSWKRISILQSKYNTRRNQCSSKIRSRRTTQSNRRYDKGRMQKMNTLEIIMNELRSQLEEGLLSRYFLNSYPGKSFTVDLEGQIDISRLSEAIDNNIKKEFKRMISS
jgi:hypothetical protein